MCVDCRFWYSADGIQNKRSVRGELRLQVDLKDAGVQSFDSQWFDNSDGGSRPRGRSGAWMPRERPRTKIQLRVIRSVHEECV